MLVPTLIIGLILIIAGFMVKRNPNLIAGYNSLTKEQKKKVDINGMSTMMRNYFVITGIFVVLIQIVLTELEVKPHYSLLVSSSLIVIAILIMALHAKKYNKF